MTTNTIPTVLCIDVEPDGRDPGRVASWHGFEMILMWARELRSRFARLTGREVRLTWFLRADPQVAELTGSPGFLAERFSAELDELQADGDAIGLHTHAWRWDRASARWVADWGDRPWVEECLEIGHRAYEAAFGRVNRVHRFGDRFVASWALERLASLGVEVDLSVEPGARPTRLYRGWRSTIRAIDHAHAPRVPYHPGPRDPFSAVEAGRPTVSWELPLTAVDRTDALPVWRRAARAIRYPGRVRHRPLVLWAPERSAGYWDRVERELAAAPAPYLAVAIRSDVLLRPTAANALNEKLDALAASSLAARLWFTEPLQAIQALTTATHR